MQTRSSNRQFVRRNNCLRIDTIPRPNGLSSILEDARYVLRSEDPKIIVSLSAVVEDFC